MHLCCFKLLSSTPGTPGSNEVRWNSLDPVSRFSITANIYTAAMVHWNFPERNKQEKWLQYAYSNSLKAEWIQCMKHLYAHKLTTNWKQKDAVFKINELPSESKAFRMSSWPEKEVRGLVWVKWRICHKIPFISSWLTGASGSGERKSALMCSEALANHTWPLPSTLTYEWWALGTICCSALLKCQLQ